MMNTLYTISTVICLIPIIGSFFDKRLLFFLRETSVIFLFRNMVRLLDFEKSRQYMTDGQWASLCVLQSSMGLFYTSIFIHSFDNSLFLTKLYACLQALATLALGHIGVFMIDGHNLDGAAKQIPFLGNLLLMIFFVLSGSGVHEEFLTQFISFLEEQDIFKHTLNNFNEPLIIFNDSKPWFVNTFLQKFLVESSVEQSHISVSIRDE